MWPMKGRNHVMGGSGDQRTVNERGWRSHAAPLASGPPDEGSAIG